MTGYAGNIVTLRIDLNRLRGNRVVTRRDFVEGGYGLLPHLRQGEVVRVVEEEGDAYSATVERIEGLLVYLRVDLHSWTPAIENVQNDRLYAPEFRPEISNPGTKPVLAPA